MLCNAIAFFLMQDVKSNVLPRLFFFNTTKSKLFKQKMSDNEVDEEERSFLREITSHLPLNWSDERRDNYVQHVLASWRKHREHSREEERLMEKYLSTIKEHFKYQSPELYDFTQWPIDENLLNMIKHESLDSDIIKQVCRYSFICSL